MIFPVTKRIKQWYEGDEIHFAVASPKGMVKIGIAKQGKFSDNETMILTLHENVAKYVKPELKANPWIALAPGGQGGILAPYQLKGLATLKGNKITVKLKELYITKPGPEAGLRFDHKTLEELERFEKEHGWTPKISKRDIAARLSKE